jgi:hypothetical protein
MALDCGRSTLLTTACHDHLPRRRVAAALVRDSRASRSSRRRPCRNWLSSRSRMRRASSASVCGIRTAGADRRRRASSSGAHSRGTPTDTACRRARHQLACVSDKLLDQLEWRIGDDRRHAERRHRGQKVDAISSGRIYAVVHQIACNNVTSMRA